MILHFLSDGGEPLLEKFWLLVAREEDANSTQGSIPSLHDKQLSRPCHVGIREVRRCQLRCWLDKPCALNQTAHHLFHTWLIWVCLKSIEQLKLAKLVLNFLSYHSNGKGKYGQLLIGFEWNFTAQKTYVIYTSSTAQGGGGSFRIGNL